MYFNNRKHRHTWRFSWHLLFGFFMILATAFLIVGGVVESEPMRKIVLLAAKILYGIGGMTAVFAAMMLLNEMVQSLKVNTEKLDNTVEMLSRGNNLLTQVSQASRLSDTAKEIVYRDSEQMELGEAALTKLHQHDFDDADAMIAAMAEHPKYQHLSERLKLKADKFRSATEEGRVNQIITHIDDLLDQKLWIQAASQIDSLIRNFPYSEKAKTMPARLQERKDRHKRQLLADWDQAVRNKQTDRGLEILKELDLYLTPAEALALQESASSVFRTKLHNLGVEFSVAITENNWKTALETGRHIVQNFPNSRMAAEIRSKMDILQERSTQTKKTEPETE
jgi:outer membrane protein assembly factor BamD (BamD/ComL family)